MTKIRNGLALLVAAIAILAGLTMMSNKGDLPFYDFKNGGPLYRRNLVPSMSPGRHQVTISVVWNGTKPDYIMYNVAGIQRHVGQSEIAGGQRGSWNRSFVYVPGAFYSVQPTITEDGSLDCLIAVDDRTYSANHRDDAGPLRCYINEP